MTKDSSVRSGGVPLIPTAASITLAALGLAVDVFAHEDRVRKPRADVTHVHSEKPLGKRARRRAKAKVALHKGNPNGTE